jgi:PPOX class probable F420-dependent enzyme
MSNVFAVSVHYSTPAEARTARERDLGPDLTRGRRWRREVTAMRRNLRPEDLGDLLERPLNAILALHRDDGSILLTPVWHEWRDDGFRVAVPAGDRKIAMLERDPRLSLIVAENEFPYRTIEVRGVAHLSPLGYREIAPSIFRRYLDAYDPDTPVEAYMSAAGGAIVRVESTATRAWDYSDDVMV